MRRILARQSSGSAVHLILSHENADFDAVASMLAAFKLYPDGIPVLSERQNRNVASFLALYRSALPFVTRDDYQPERIRQVTLVDTRHPPQVRGIKHTTPLRIIDHHPLTDELGANEAFVGEPVGANTTLLVEEMQRQHIVLSTLEATLLALGIYEDTGSLLYGATTPRDLQAAAWLVEHGAALDTVRRFLEPPLNDEQQALLETLITTSESRTIQGLTIVVGAARLDRYLSELSAVAHRLRDTLDPSALFLVVEMPGAMHLVCRSTSDALDAGEIARAFGGGGHERAAAATLHNVSLEQAVEKLWSLASAQIHSAETIPRVADLMSFGVQTILAQARLGDIVRKVRRIGHEGYPVVENDKIVGLLTRRDVDRAMEHELTNLTVREIMMSGSVTLTPDDSISLLEQRMVESGWGQIPVLSSAGKVIGIVTRTDLIKYWSRIHPSIPAPPPEVVTREQFASVLGEPAGTFIQALAERAQAQHLSIYVVGGVVRDLLLGRKNLDVDFVVEGNAVEFAESLSARYGGEVSSFRPFGTASWRLNEAAAAALNLPLDALPDHVDFATARNEFYEHPTALPTVYSGSIKLDLGRRDFTLNTLAIQLSPEALEGRILDYYGGLKDLRKGVIRALHSLSFVDDPTRILRAVRFEQRLNFTIEPRTAELIQTALPMLRRITGERIRNELTLLLREPNAAQSLLILQERGILQAIHPALILQPTIVGQFEQAKNTGDFLPLDDLTLLYWHIIATYVESAALRDVCERLMFGKSMVESMQSGARLLQIVSTLEYTERRPSAVVMMFDGISDMALLAVWVVNGNLFVRNAIQQYATKWRSVRPSTDGHTLQALGLPPGPCYGRLLNRLQTARLDGEVSEDDEEAALLNRLLREGFCDGGA
jgi:tRNA nucleotidyltransferase (CCA-adding enzyme)